MRANTSSGLTIVELVIAIAISAIVLLGMMPLLTNLFQVAGSSIATAKQVNETQRAASIIASDMQITNSFLGKPLSSDTKTPAPGGGWTFRGSSATARTLLLRMPATTAAYQNSTRQLVYNANTGSCFDSARPLYNTVIYYLQSSTLYRRTLIDTSATPCPGQTIFQKTSCQSGGGCSETDVTVATGVTQFVVDYYTVSNDKDPNTTIYNAATNIDAPTLHASAKVTLTTQRSYSGKTNDSTVSIRETKVW